MTARETIEGLKHAGEYLTGVKRPTAEMLKSLVRLRQAHCWRFADDGETPNNPRFPLVLYKSPVRLSDAFDPAGIFEALFASNKWGDSWRDSIFPYNHFHTKSHEVLGIARGRVDVQFGGDDGRVLALKGADVVVIPAGVGHRRRKASADLLVVGAYPHKHAGYDEPRPDDINFEKARRSIARVAAPHTDPVYGARGPLLAAWVRKGRD